MKIAILKTPVYFPYEIILLYHFRVPNIIPWDKNDL